ncbi:MAG: hypothetical protein KDD10_21095 [Phaeodactylibacter sp.]|nr:hypothetical protein [Phaeodactylibacter sp.]
MSNFFPGDAELEYFFYIYICYVSSISAGPIVMKPVGQETPPGHEQKDEPGLQRPAPAAGSSTSSKSSISRLFLPNPAAVNPVRDFPKTKYYGQHQKVHKMVFGEQFTFAGRFP